MNIPIKLKMIVVGKPNLKYVQKSNRCSIEVVNAFWATIKFATLPNNVKFPAIVVMKARYKIKFKWSPVRGTCSRTSKVNGTLEKILLPRRVKIKKRNRDFMSINVAESRFNATLGDKENSISMVLKRRKDRHTRFDEEFQLNWVHQAKQTDRKRVEEHSNQFEWELKSELDDWWMYQQLRE